MNLVSTIMRFAPLALCATAFIAGPAFAASGNSAAGKDKSVTCQACHGADGNSIDPMYPRLAGQYADYLARALHEYKDGGRKNPIMAGFATTLSDQDILDLAAFYGTMPSKLDDLHRHMKAD